MRIDRALPLFLALFVIPAAFGQSTCGAPPVLIAPANGAENVTTPVTFTWTAVEGALEYEVWAAFDGGEFEELESTRDTGLFDDVPPSAIIDWYVVAIFTTCSRPSSVARFTTGDCDPPAAELVAPLDGASLSAPVAFLWREVEETDGYRLWLDGRVVAETRHTEASAHVTPGTHRWYVESFFDDCGSSVSETRTFEVPRAPRCSSAKPALIAPANGAAQPSKVVTFSWNAVPGAIGYEVRAALDDGPLEVIDETTSTSITARLSTGRIAWTVTAHFNGCDDSVSDALQFTVVYDPNCDNGVPFPIAPANDADDLPTKIDFVWTPVAGAKRYNVVVYSEEGEGEAISLGSTTATRLTAEVPAGELAWVVEAEFENCASEVSPMFLFDTVEAGECRVPSPPEIFLDARARSGDAFKLIWSARLHAASYEVQEAMRADFSDASTRTTSDILLTFAREVKEETRYFYRVRANSSCGLEAGQWSPVASIVITPATSSAADRVDLPASYGEQHLVVQKIRIPGSSEPRPFTARMDKSWLSVSPSSGTIPLDGIELAITADPRNLPIGSNSATLVVEGGQRPLTLPISMNLVTLVTPNAGNAPLPSSLIIPVVAHADGAGGKYESDVRLANVSAQTMKYLLLFTPSRSDGTRAGQQATIQVGPGQTAALNDVLKNVFGYAKATDSITGTLEIRPLTASGSTRTTFASSRTFAGNAFGTFGQFIPAIPYSRFIGRSDASLVLQQIAQSALYRTNIGLVEASGEPATVRASIFSDAGAPAGEIDIPLKAGEHIQLGAFLAQHGIRADDGRIEIAVMSGSGKVTAYASVLDNRTNDAMMVVPVDTSAIAASRYVLPGIADYGTRWQSDVRVFNAGSETTATFTYFPEGEPAHTRVVTRTLAAGQVLSIDGALQSLFGVTNSGGAIVVTTPSASRLVVSARTYTQSDRGTYSQFIPAATVADGVSVGDRALQLLQVEESERFRTNVGIVELTGHPVTVEVSAHTPDSKFAAVARLELQASECRQLVQLLRSLGFPATYNARVTLKVVGGSGTISGYASLIDNSTNDGTYIPAQ